ncbi:hypothetical protein [Desulfatirhabdium butyrativorans]|uniref:hypothetical protein n=1 Tax=Desulfatirhabdium butyrativorans TaxID=340467 RepID=UPI000482509F|nr:hypothetical protein [Desulfatirhabdium butyrativorans]
MCFLAGATIASEFIIRWFFRLDCHPLYSPHATIEYLLQPSQNIVCDGKIFQTNRWSMRSPDFENAKPPGEIRLLVFGDSVVNGTVLDQRELATSLLTIDLTQRFRKPVIIGNISAASWGIPNYLAYEKEYGLFNADAVVLVFSSHDIYDVPTFDPLSPINQPQTRRQFLLPHFIKKLFGWLQDNGLQLYQPLYYKDSEKLKAICVKALEDFYTDLRKQGIPLLLVFHYQKDELASEQDNAFIEWANANGVTVVSDRQALAAALRTSQNPYMDIIHLNAIGQGLLEQVILSGLDKTGLLKRSAHARLPLSMPAFDPFNPHPGHSVPGALPKASGS